MTRMAFKDFPAQTQAIRLLQRALERGRLAHAYLFNGSQLEELESLARTLAKTLDCLQPLLQNGKAVDCCDQCLNCRKIEHANHADVHWVRPESKSRVITIEQMRDLMQVIQLKSTEGGYKVAMIVAADRLNVQAANAFLKTLEEPPPKCVLVLLTTDSQRVLETILSRCLRLNFAGESQRQVEAGQMAWLVSFSETAARPQKSLMGRYRLIDVLLQKLNQMRQSIDETLTARSPLQRYPDVEKDLAEKWEDELKAAIEAEYRRQRSDLLLLLQWWLRDVWIEGMKLARANRKAEMPEAKTDASGSLLTFPQINGTAQVAGRVGPRAALENLNIMEELQQWLTTNVQEALALEVGLLKLQL